MNTSRHLVISALIASLLLSTSGCALLTPEAPRSDLETQRRLELLDNHLEEVRTAAQWRRRVTAAATAGSGVATIAVGMYVRTVETAEGPPAQPTDPNQQEAPFSTGLFLTGGILVGFGVFLYFFPSTAEFAVEHYKKRRGEPNDAEELFMTPLTFGERTLQSVALSDLNTRMQYGAPLLLGGLGLIALGTTANEELDTQGITTFVALGLLSAIGGGIITFSRTEAERRWSQYQDEVEAMQAGEPAPTSHLEVLPVLLPSGGGLVGSLTF